MREFEINGITYQLSEKDVERMKKAGVRLREVRRAISTISAKIPETPPSEPQKNSGTQNKNQCASMDDRD